MVRAENQPAEGLQNPPEKIMGPIPDSGLREALEQVAASGVTAGIFRVVSKDLTGYVSLINSHYITGALLKRTRVQGFPALKQIFEARRGMYALVASDQEANFTASLNIDLRDILDWRSPEFPDFEPQLSDAINGLMGEPMEHPPKPLPEAKTAGGSKVKGGLQAL